uniref:Phosphodiester glycosidase domain-containing protein n=1 Tax=Cyanothece sp. (strain PCC 7425 / ATCC 29141) TaxID=395961 RepID=B8HTR4_CYAP4
MTLTLFSIAALLCSLWVSEVKEDSIPATLASSLPPPPNSPATQEGNQLLLNGRRLEVNWGQWLDPQGRIVTGISDGDLRTQLGGDLQNSNDPTRQPVIWFSNQDLPLVARFNPTGTYRYLDITALAQRENWQVQVRNQTLEIQTPPSQIVALRRSRQPWGERIVLELDRPTPWKITRLTNSRDGKIPREFVLSLDAPLSSTKDSPSAIPGGFIPLKLTTTAKQTALQATLPGTFRPQVSMLSAPPRLVVDLQQDSQGQRNILWSSGVRWREQTLAVGGDRYPLTWLEINPHQAGLQLRPIWNQPDTLVGIQPLPRLAQRWQVAAAINGGFFNRNQQVPLGAIRQSGSWISSPILNRGAIGWNDQGEFTLGRLRLQQTLITASGQSLPINTLDSGFVQKGIARYTRAWGPTYTPRVAKETVITVVNDRVAGQQTASANTPTPILIPPNGYLLVLRDVPLPVFGEGSLQIQMNALPADFNRFPQILGAGPLLLERGQIVLNPDLEQFGNGLDAQQAPRSGIGRTSTGQILLVTTHNRIGGAGPTLAEWAAILKTLGAVDALNLDGGSSTALYLGGQLLDRHPVTSARVQNAIGLFLRPVEAPPLR